MKKRAFFLLLSVLLAGCANPFAHSSSSNNSSYFSSSPSGEISSSPSNSISGAISSFSSYSSQTSYSGSISSGSSGSSSTSTTVIPSRTVTFDFYNLNDFHGAIERNTDLGEPGLARIASYLKAQKANNPDGFVLTNSGDMWQGSALSNLNRGQLVNEWMNYMDFKCMTLGNHEFDWGIDVIKNAVSYANFPVISCNIQNSSSQTYVDWIQPSAIQEINGVKIGFVGSIGEDQTGDIIASISHNLKFETPSYRVNSEASRLKNQGAELLVYLCHDSADSIPTSVARNFNVIFCGHTHTGEKQMISNVPCIQAYSNGKDIGHIKLTYNTRTKEINYNTYDYVDIRNYSGADDQGTLEIINKYLTPEVDAKINKVVGYCPNGLARNNQVNLLLRYMYNYYQENIHEYTIFATNYNNSRSDMPRGNITYKDVFKSFPFDNKLCVMKIKGNALKTITYGTFYYPNGDSINDNNYYYIFTIDYIAEYDVYYSPNLGAEIVAYYPDLLPRDIFANYLANDYPIRN